MNVKYNFALVVGIAMIVSVPATLLGIGALFFATPQEATYTYEVKAQQAFDVDRVDERDVTHFDNLSSDEQEVLHEAFKKSDHFFGSESVTVNTGTERMEVFHTWRSVEVNGIIIVVAIEEDTGSQPDTSVPWVDTLRNVTLVSSVVFVISFSLFMVTPASWATPDRRP